MANQLLLDRLRGLQAILAGAHAGGSGLASACLGAEREAFINLVLCNVISPPFRIGTGEVTDHDGRRSGQVDIVIEFAGSMSFPLMRGDSSRLYLAEGICAVIEVKSDLQSKWDEVIAKAEKVRALVPNRGTIAEVGYVPEHIPFFAVGYRGWKDAETIKAKLQEQKDKAGPVDGVLILDGGLYVGREAWNFVEHGYAAHSMNGERALYGLLLSLEQIMSSMMWMKPHYMNYVI